MLNNLLDSYLRPQYEQIRLNESTPNLQPQSHPAPQPQAQPSAQSAFPFAALFDKPRLNESQPNSMRDPPQMEHPRLNESQPNSQHNLPAVSTVDINSKTNSLSRSKSADFLRMVLPAHADPHRREQRSGS
jgi:hypothetical protein